MHKYKESNTALAIEFIQQVRDGVKLPEDAERGYRFNDDCGVLYRLQAMFTEDEFLGGVVHTVEMSLLDAAKADHWYAEKAQDEAEEWCPGNCYGGHCDNGDFEADAC